MPPTIRIGDQVGFEPECGGRTRVGTIVDIDGQDATVRVDGDDNTVRIGLSQIVGFYDPKTRIIECTEFGFRSGFQIVASAKG